mmetsp:Transcript_11021/g.18159  ORF Transcript_11021/g.18159 Transcript_11021/m.18159 type:complete len:92 (-) Transcript_11021:1892-2167(-)
MLLLTPLVTEKTTWRRRALQRYIFRCVCSDASCDCRMSLRLILQLHIILPRLTPAKVGGRPTIRKDDSIETAITQQLQSLDCVCHDCSCEV